MMDFYGVTKHISKLYSRLQDDLSRDVWENRVLFDIHPTADRLFHLIQSAGLLTPEEMAVQLRWRDGVAEILEQGGKLVLYGAGIRGGLIARCLLNEKVKIAGFCDRNYKEFTNGLLNLPVFSPDDLLARREEYYVIITSAAFRGEIVQFLRENNFPEDHILPYFSDYFAEHGRSAAEQYFEFPELFPKGTAFVDGGCFDGQDSSHFARWCGGEYTKIFAFEPDSVNFERCKENLAGLSNVEVIHAGLGEKSTTETFLSYGQVHSRFASPKKESHIVDETLFGASAEEIQLVALDDLAEQEKIGFIKMDIEGAEWGALHGAEKTILRDKPLLAICVYHIPGDTLAIMDYLAELVPEYRFWLRHYGTSNSETVLYASVKENSI